MQKEREKNTKQVYWSTQGCDFNTYFMIKVETVTPELYLTQSVTCNFHVDEF